MIPCNCPFRYTRNSASGVVRFYPNPCIMVTSPFAGLKISVFAPDPEVRAPFTKLRSVLELFETKLFKPLILFILFRLQFLTKGNNWRKAHWSREKSWRYLFCKWKPVQIFGFSCLLCATTRQIRFHRFHRRERSCLFLPLNSHFNQFQVVFEKRL